MTINFFKSFFLGITCSLFMACHSHEAPPMQIQFTEFAMQSVRNHPIITVAVSVLLIKYFILNPALNYIIEHNGPIFLANIFYYMAARVNAALLWSACSNNNTCLALRCLKYGANPRLATENYEGPFCWLCPTIYIYAGGRPWNCLTNVLQIACGFRDEKLVKALLEAGAEVNDDDFSHSWPRTPIGFSLEQQKLGEQIYEISDNIINTLLEHGALLGCLQAKRSYKWEKKDLCTTFEKLSSRKQITIPENAIEDAVNYILFITKPSDDFLWWLRRDPAWDNFYFLFYHCDNEWIYHLCNMIHNHIKNEEKRNDLLLKLCSIKIKNDKEKTIDQHIIKSIVANNNKTFFETLKKEESYDIYCIKGSNALLSFVYQKNDKVFAKQLYKLYQNKNINLDKMWENAATMNTTCLKTLLKLSSNPLEVLRKKSNYNQSIFYLAITHNDSFREKALQYVTKRLKEPEIFLTQEVNNAIEIKECTKLDIFVQFYNDNENLQQLIQPVAQKAKLQYDLLCYQHQQNLSICNPSRELQFLESVYSKFQPYI